MSNFNFLPTHISREGNHYNLSNLGLGVTNFIWWNDIHSVINSDFNRNKLGLTSFRIRYVWDFSSLSPSFLYLFLFHLFNGYALFWLYKKFLNFTQCHYTIKTKVVYSLSKLRYFSLPSKKLLWTFGNRYGNRVGRVGIYLLKLKYKFSNNFRSPSRSPTRMEN